MQYIVADKTRHGWLSEWLKNIYHGLYQDGKHILELLPPPLTYSLNLLQIKMDAGKKRINPW